MEEVHYCTNDIPNRPIEHMICEKEMERSEFSGIECWLCPVCGHIEEVSDGSDNRD